MNNKYEKRKRIVAIVLVVVFGGSILLSGIITLVMSFSKGDAEVYSQQPPAPVSTSAPTQKPETANSATPEKSAAPANAKSEEKAETPEAASIEETENQTPVSKTVQGKVFNSLISPDINYTIKDKTFLISAKLDAPDDTVFTVVVASTDMTVNKKANAPIKNGEVNFSVDVEDTDKKYLCSFQLSMTENTQPDAAIDLYGRYGENILADTKNGGRVTKIKNSDGKEVKKFDFMFKIDK